MEPSRFKEVSFIQRRLFDEPRSIRDMDLYMTGNLRRLLLGVMAIAPGIGACDKHGENRRGCPSEAFLREVHAAAFYFEHEEPQQGREHLEAAKKVFRDSPGNERGAQLLTGLRVVAALPEGDDQIKVQTEHLRFLLTDWKCLPEELHGKFHSTLPPIR